jgi:hypothetical protein
LQLFRWLMLSAVVGAGACSLVVQTEELVNGAPDASHADVGVDVPTKDVATDSTDGSHQDSPVEAELDAPADNVVADVDAGTYCETLSPTPTICSDFDVQALPAGWDALSGYGAFTGVIDEENFTSPLRSIVFTTPVLAAGDSGSRALSAEIPTPTQSFSIEFDILAEALDDTWNWFIVLESSSSNGTVTARFRARSGGYDIHESVEPAGGGPIEYGGHSISGTPSATTWQHVKWSVDLSGTNAFSNVDLDGMISGGGSLMKGYLDNPTLRIGIPHAQSPSVAQKLRFDNIVVRVQ